MTPHERYRDTNADTGTALAIPIFLQTSRPCTLYCFSVGQQLHGVIHGRRQGAERSPDIDGDRLGDARIYRVLIVCLVQTALGAERQARHDGYVVLVRRQMEGAC